MFSIVLIIILNANSQFTLLWYVNSLEITDIQIINVTMLEDGVKFLLYRFNIFVF